jgi:hypothetical protein
MCTGCIINNHHSFTATATATTSIPGYHSDSNPIDQMVIQYIFLPKQQSKQQTIRTNQRK